MLKTKEDYEEIAEKIVDFYYKYGFNNTRKIIDDILDAIIVIEYEKIGNKKPKRILKK